MSAQRWIELVKKAALEAYEASYPVKVLFGRVASAAPLAVRIDQKHTIPQEFLTVAAGTRRIQDVQPGLQAGDKVVLLRMQGGQRYILLDKVVE